MRTIMLSPSPFVLAWVRLSQLLLDLIGELLATLRILVERGYLVRLEDPLGWRLLAALTDHLST
jgi:hypothetical protein